ncbi:DUF1090 domain-containing protein [Bordetella genomosp. 5]|uniref:DUF1090 domain-containing protein n=1 Tax=Bordetella genomosp. 5 TaxID=1395608 RepID=UPI000B9E6C7D|nr:DUF1090 domain-containing protein [Bordetella genomosp. 5]
MNPLLRRITLASFVLGSALASSTALAQESPLRGCAAKKQSIERELTHAREHGNSNRVRGLEKALAAAQDCDDASLQRERQEKVRDAEKKVKEREEELAEEKAEGKRKDIQKAERKLKEAQDELAAARADVHR